MYKSHEVLQESYITCIISYHMYHIKIKVQFGKEINYIE